MRRFNVLEEVCSIKGKGKEKKSESQLQLYLVASMLNVYYFWKTTKREKRISKLLSNPKDFTWDELTKVLSGLGYEQISIVKTGGSRVRFIYSDYPPIIMHKPHPKPILKRYQLEAIVNLLQREKFL
jgi:hypothetical protein